MNYPPDFLNQLKERASNRCECERGDCHGAPGRCGGKLDASPGGSWSPVFTGESITFPPVTSNYIALCAPCAVPRTRKG